MAALFRALLSFLRRRWRVYLNVTVIGDHEQRDPEATNPMIDRATLGVDELPIGMNPEKDPTPSGPNTDPLFRIAPLHMPDRSDDPDDEDP